MHSSLYSIFKNGSKTYFYSSLFFPGDVRDDVFSLYSFARRADDFVDSVPQQKKEFFSFRRNYQNAMKGHETGDIVVDSFARLSEKRSFQRKWTDSFFKSMKMDLTKSTYKTMDELQEYIFGSAEVIGLMMARILSLPERSYPYARSLGKSMQYINFVRDVDEDLKLKRTYFPQEDFDEFGIESLTPNFARSHPRDFSSFLRKQISYYDGWHANAEKGFSLIPRRYLIPIRTASDMYKWTANTIRRSPLIVYEKKVKPSIPRIVANVGYNSLRQ